MKSLEKILMTKLRTTHDNFMRSSISQTKIIRVIKFFPKTSNHSKQKIVCYGDYNNIILTLDFCHCDINVLKGLLPNRISVFADEFYLNKKKNFDFYNVNQK